MFQTLLSCFLEDVMYDAETEGRSPDDCEHLANAPATDE